uniref:Uncharacterized protein n=1 Tax=Anopheles culicifacies TaxID=139723 RepID=A0A182LYC4_9DIPT
MTTGEELRRSRQCFERDVVCRMLHKTSKQCCLRPIVRPRELESIVSTPVPPIRTLPRIGDPSCTGVKVPVSNSTPLNIKYLLATAIHQREWLRFGLSSPISSSSSVIIIMIVGMAGRVPVYQSAGSWFVSHHLAYDDVFPRCWTFAFLSTHETHCVCMEGFLSRHNHHAV